MPPPLPPKTFRSLRAEALRSLVALHSQDPGSVLELSILLESGANICARANPGVACAACAAKRETAALLRSVATLRELVDGELLLTDDRN